MRSLTAMDDRRTLIAWLRERDATGEIGKNRYFVGNEPCDVLGHVAQWLGIDSRLIGISFHLQKAFNEKFDSDMIAVENDEESTTTAIDLLAELLHVEECAP